MDSLLPLCTQPEYRGVIGVGREDITPPVGIYARNWGAAEHEVAEGIHRPLTATVLTLQSALHTQPLVLVALDLGWWRAREDEWHVRGELIDMLGLDPDRVMICLSHTHSGPSLCREDHDKPGGHLVADYLDSLQDTVIRAVHRALASPRSGILTWGVGRCDLARHRDLPDPERPRVVCGFHPDHAADDTLLVGRATSEQGEAIATVVNYACHPVTLAWQNRLISPDFVGTLREVVESHTGGAPCLFLQGASGELAPREVYTGDTQVADAHGRRLGFAVVSVLEGLLPPAIALEYAGVQESGAPLALWNRVPHVPPARLEARCVDVDLPLQPLTPLPEIPTQLEGAASSAPTHASLDRVYAERVLRKQRVRKAVGEGATAAMPLWVWRVGSALMVGHPNEAYSWLQTELRRRFPDLTIAVMNVVNGHFGYLPPQDLYSQDIYQVWQTPLAPGCLERVLAAAEQTVRDLMADELGL